MPEDENYRFAVGRVSRRYLIASARQIQSRRHRDQPNWSFVADLFGLGSTYAFRLCSEEGIDPDGHAVAHFAPMAAAEQGGGYL